MRLALTTAAVAAFLTISVTPASANPWDGGLDVQSPGEAAFSAIASEIAGRPATVRCWSPEEWAANPIGGGLNLRGYVLHDGKNVAELSPQACGPLDAFRIATPKPACAGPSRDEDYTIRVRQWRWKYVRRNGKRVRVRYRAWVRVWRTRIVPGPPVFCASAFPAASDTSLAAQTLAHEAVHLRGVTDEAVAECHGRQLAKTVLLRLGAPNVGYAYSLGAFTLAIYPPGSPYYSPECRDGGALDLEPANPIWP